MNKLSIIIIIGIIALAAICTIAYSIRINISKNESVGVKNQRDVKEMFLLSQNHIPKPEYIRPVDTDKIVDCGVLSDSNPNNTLKLMSESACFNEQFKMCQPAAMTGVLKTPDYVIGNKVYSGGQTTTYIILGQTTSGCEVSSQYVVPNAIENPTIYNCIYDHSLSWNDASKKTPNKCF